VGTERSTCLSCGRPQRLFSIPSGAYYLRKLGQGALWLLESFLKLTLIGFGLYVCFTISPFLILAPLFFALTSTDRVQ
jgi:hypothetical protein